MKQILLLPYGTHGDVLPFVWLGKLLIHSGHRVTLISSPRFAPLVAHAGIKFMPLKDLVSKELADDPGMTQGLTATRLAYTAAGRAMGEFIEVIDHWMSQSGKPDLLLAPSACYAARMMREKDGIPLVTVHHSPLLMRSVHEPALLIPAFRWLRMLPLWLRKLILSGRNPFDRHALPALRQHCAAHGIAPPHDLDKEWHQSPDGVLALFPPWYAKPQPDWPPSLLQWDFPLEDMGDVPLAPELLRFLKEGEKPVVFTPGTGHMHAHRFFATALEIVEMLRCRAVFATRDLGQLPAALPSNVHAVDYAPFSALLPHAAAFVHHGGPGNVSQCFAAGIPQLVVPMAFDQFDHADRVVRTGAGLSISVSRFDAKHALPLLKRCLDDSGLSRRAIECAERLRHRPHGKNLVSWLESRMNA